MAPGLAHCRAMFGDLEIEAADLDALRMRCWSEPSIFRADVTHGLWSLRFARQALALADEHDRIAPDTVMPQVSGAVDSGSPVTTPIDAMPSEAVAVSVVPDDGRGLNGVNAEPHVPSADHVPFLLSTAYRRYHEQSLSLRRLATAAASDFPGLFSHATDCELRASALAHCLSFFGDLAIERIDADRLRRVAGQQPRQYREVLLTGIGVMRKERDRLDDAWHSDASRGPAPWIRSALIAN